MPGSPAKLQVMIDRVERGEHPHHPLDARDRAMDNGWDAADSLWGELWQRESKDRTKKTRAKTSA